jgi:hypothetical protein
MAVNRYRPHVYVLPEDDANGQIANGFLLDPHVMLRNIQVLEEAGGWENALAKLNSDYACPMEQYPLGFMVLLIDFDGRGTRFVEARDRVPAALKDRAFIVGALTRPEELRAELGTYETIGKALAKDCRENTDTTWGSALLRHNEPELRRLRRQVVPILFGGAA